MHSSSSTLLSIFSMKPKDENTLHLLDLNKLQRQANIPTQFMWPKEDMVGTDGVFNEPLIDLEGFIKGDKIATAKAIEHVRTACTDHGFFQVINHGVDTDLIQAAYREIDAVFELPFNKKLGFRQKPGGYTGFSSAHAERFSSSLPWKETFSFMYRGMNSHSAVVDYFTFTLGQDFENAGLVYQKYCERMSELSLIIMELLALSLGVDRSHYRKFFEDGTSIMRCNYYPPCKNPGVTFGTGPHCDPNSITIIHQDQVGGLEILAGDKWLAVTPRPDAFTINIGDTFMAFSNGIYKSCIHRALVNEERGRRSLVCFVSPKEDMVVRPPEDLVVGSNRVYPDFTWSSLLDFTNNHRRTDLHNLENFFPWLLSSQPKVPT
ncbi:gibberellin 20 oxidase 2 [Hibiscus trionum]|uniref:Gibberellin 20 oxidase 2 n=1 Tax=Hibiscus trionum TaxID=183268 RepID=A0A9W7LJZ7_HIBTR|nr:gibberellin 20 oxidase 2 [Hibiscus trionum]